MATRTSLEPVGVVSVFALSHAGLYAPASAMACALAAGNTVVLQPAPGLTASLVAFVAALPGAERLVQVVTGDEETADLLAVTTVDQAYVVGSGRTAARIAGQCGQRLVATTLVPVDPPLTVVAPDADLDAAAAAVARSVAAGSRASQEWRPEVFVAPDVSADFERVLHAALVRDSIDAPSALGRRQRPLPRALTPRRSRSEMAAAIGAGPTPSPVVVHENSSSPKCSIGSARGPTPTCRSSPASAGSGSARCCAPPRSASTWAPSRPMQAFPAVRGGPVAMGRWPAMQDCAASPGPSPRPRAAAGCHSRWLPPTCSWPPRPAGWLPGSRCTCATRSTKPSRTCAQLTGRRNAG